MKYSEELQDRIDAYLLKSDNPEARAKLETEMVENPDLAREIEEQAKLLQMVLLSGRKEMKEQLERIHLEVIGGVANNGEASVIQFRRWAPYLAAAAAVILILIAIRFIPGGPEINPEELLVINDKNIANDLPISRITQGSKEGNENKEKIEREIFQLVKEGTPESLIEATEKGRKFQTIDEDSDYSKLILGQILAKRKEYSEAIELLRGAVALSANPNNKVRAQWLLVNSLLARNEVGDRDEAVEELGKFQDKLTEEYAFESAAKKLYHILN